jgi:hypothetical protein
LSDSIKRMLLLQRLMMKTITAQPPITIQQKRLGIGLHVIRGVLDGVRMVMLKLNVVLVGRVYQVFVVLHVVQVLLLVVNIVVVQIIVWNHSLLEMVMAKTVMHHHRHHQVPHNTGKTNTAIGTILLLQVYVSV